MILPTSFSANCRAARESPFSLSAATESKSLLSTSFARRGLSKHFLPFFQKGQGLVFRGILTPPSPLHTFLTSRHFTQDPPPQKHFSSSMLARYYPGPFQIEIVQANNIYNANISSVCKHTRLSQKRTGELAIHLQKDAGKHVKPDAVHRGERLCCPLQQFSQKQICE